MFCTPGTADLCAARAARRGAHSGRGRARRRIGAATRSTNPRCRSTPSKTHARALSQLQPVGYDRPMPVVPGRRRRVHQRRPPARLGVRRACGCDGRDASCSAAISGATTGRCCRIRRRSPKRTCCSSNRPTAIALHEPTTTARGSRDRQRDRRARRQGDHPGVCDRPRRGDAVLAEAARGANSGFPVLPVYVDSPMAARGAAVLRAAVATSSTPTCAEPAHGT